MKSYFLIGLVGVLGVLILDKKLKTKVWQSKKFWKLQIVVVLIASLVDNYISGRPFVIFNPEAVWGAKVGFVPWENYIFGFDMISLNIILFEYFKKKG